ncbi:MAG TPA: sigma-70 family RNA polymerase sigma factor [Thermoleophilia bacterium]
MGRVWRTARHEDGLGSSDARIVEGLRRGTPAAFADLHERYAAGIYNLALRVVRHGPDAEDITQDVLIRAFERLPRDREVRLRPWLYRLTLNRCYDYLRGSARRPLVAAPGREVVSPHDLFEQSELQGLLEASIGDLTPRQRAALLLKDVHGLSLTEVAGCLEVTPGSVEVLLARARRAFRASYEERCVAAGRPLPRSAGGLAMLPMLPLPAGLAVPAVVPLAAPALHVPVVAPPLTLATGSGIGAVLGLPASVKTAMLIAAAAATVGTAEIAVTHADRRPPRQTVVAAAVVVPTPSATATRAGTRSTVHTSLSPLPAALTPTPSPSGEPLPSATPTALAGPTPEGSPLGITSPPATPEPSASPTPSAAPTPSPSPTPSQTASPSPTPSQTATPEPGASASPSSLPSP